MLNLLLSVLNSLFVPLYNPRRDVETAFRLPQNGRNVIKMQRCWRGRKEEGRERGRAQCVRGKVRI